jgi:dihydrodipicolinate synthase/N-acetylneuraminate lyase
MPVQLRGILAAVTTPFTADGSAIDEPVIKTQVERLVAAGIHGLVRTGTTGEFMILSPTEYRRVVELYVQVAVGRVPVVAGVGALSTKDAVELARDFEELGADAIMIVPPFYDPLDFPTQALAEEGDLARGRELWKHLWAISDFLESVNYVAGIKAGLDLTGHSAGPARLPIQPLSADQRDRFAGILRDAGVDVAVA